MSRCAFLWTDRTFVVTLPPLTVFASQEEAKNAPEPAAPDGISFLKEQQWKILTQTEPVAQPAAH